MATNGGLDPSLLEQRTPIDLSNPRLRKLATALGPAYMRVSGTWANTIYFQDTDAPSPPPRPPDSAESSPARSGRASSNFSKAVNAQIVTSFSIGAGTRDKNALWTTSRSEEVPRLQPLHRRHHRRR